MNNLSDMECGCVVNTTPKDFLPHYVTCNFKKEESNSENQKQTLYKNSSNAIRAFEVLDHLRKDDILCDIILETDDGAKVKAHKVILACATPYFQAMFTRFKESKTDHVILRELDSTALKVIVDFIYTTQIMMTEDNVQVVLHAASLLQLNDVRNVCCDFLLTQLTFANCLSIKKLVSLYGCVECLPSFTSFILKNFTMVVQSEEFLCLQYEELVELISSNDLNVSSEEIVFECVIKWVNHNSSSRKDVLPKLMEHVRLPLVSKTYLINNVYEEPFIKNCFESKIYLLEALRLKSGSCTDTTKTIRTKPRQSVDSSKIILVLGKMFNEITTNVKLYDPSTEIWALGPKINTNEIEELRVLGIFNNQKLFFSSDLDYQNVTMFDLYSPSPDLQQSVPLLSNRPNLGVGVLDSCIYVVGGSIDARALKSAEVFNLDTQKWKPISDMSTARSNCSVGILNDHLYVIGGHDSYSDIYLNSVERYCPKTDTWTPVADMNVPRSDVGVGTVNGIMYVVGGHNGVVDFNFVEAYNPSSNSWTLVSTMNKLRSYPGVVVLDGLLYVFCGDEPYDDDGITMINYSAEVYNPKTDVWSILTETELKSFSFSGAVVIDKPTDFKT